MIQKENLEDLVKSLGFVKNKDKYIYQFSEGYSIGVDFDKEQIIYPESAGLKINERQTCNFSSNENFVVFECVFKLLKKGYKPNHIILEPKWQVGHGVSGGRADIQVINNRGESFLIIECKTWGKEFKKYWSKTLQDGDQLFSYARQQTETKYLCMYTSDFREGKTFYQSNIISLCDNSVYLESLNNPLTYAAATDKSSLYAAWKLTYKNDYSTKGIFEDDVDAYEVGKIAYSVNDLKSVDNEDIQKKYHEFATILRQHNVSGRENAFDKLVNLFLAKIVDEIQNPDKLQFYWKGIAFDDYYSLQDRIQKLYKEGMERFLGEEVTYIDNGTIDDTFRLFKYDPDATKDTILKYFRELKFYTNNDFAFLDVHNKNLFYQNSIILLKIVKMLQDIRLKTNEQNQFLGDLFEGFLDQGIKQSEGQYFTPTPIVKFVVSALPLEKMIQSNDKPLKVIDYACGAGHFLSEYAAQIREYVSKDVVKKYYENIVGIEKEYRLSKVAKVSSFMYGQDDIKIIYADALAESKNITNGTYDILIANPPYSVKGFLETLSEEERKNYEVYSSVGKNGITTNNSIETFFVERANQLLSPGGVAAIILPASVLNKNDAIYVKTREIILKNFDIIAITEFSSSTFGKTGTNTVTLFLRKKKENPTLAQHYINRVTAWFNNDFSKDIIFKDHELLVKYCKHINIDLDLYKTLLENNISENIFSNEIFMEYKNTFERTTQWKNRIKQKTYKSLTSELKEEEYKKRLTSFIVDIEKEKLYYYLLVMSNPQSVVVVKAPDSKSDEKVFLGYEWSGTKGNEGIKYLGVDNIEDEESIIIKNRGINSIKTPLFNPNDLSDCSKINTIIRNNFIGQQLKNTYSNVSIYSLVDMIDFKRVNFFKEINTRVILSEELKSKYKKKSVEQLMINVNGKTKIAKKLIRKQGKIPVITQEKGELISGYVDGVEAITDHPVILFGDHSCTFKYVDFDFVRGADGTQLIKTDENNVKLKYLYYILSSIKITNSEKYERHFKYLKKCSIPIPEIEIQQKIIDECESVDKEFADINNTIDKYNLDIEKILEDIHKKEHQKRTVGELSLSVEYGSSAKSDKEGKVPVVRMGNIQKGKIDWSDLVYSNDDKEIEKYTLEKYDVLFNRTNSSELVGKTGIYLGERPAIFAGYLIRIKCNKNLIDPELLCYLLNSKKIREYGFSVMSKSINQANINGTLLKGYKIPVPTIDEQNSIMNEIKKIEKDIKNLEIRLKSLQGKKQEILNQYLE